MFNINQNFALKSAELFNFERDAYRTTADLFGQPLTYFPDRFVVTVTSDGSRYQLDKSKAPSNKLTPTDTLSDAERRACWLPLPTVADKSKMANMVTSTGLSGGTITIAAGDGKEVKSLANGNKGQILKIGTNGLEWANESTFTLQPPTNGKIGGVKPGSGLTVDTAGTLSIKLGSGLGFDTNGNVGISNALRLTDTTLNGNTTITGTATVSDPSNTENDSQQIANVKYVNRLVGELSQALVFRGTIPIEGKIGGMPDSAKVGDVYVVATSGTYETHVCEVGDTMICTSTGTTEFPKTTWVVVEKNIDGAVTASSELANGAIVVGSGGTKVHTIATPSTQGLVLQTTGSGFGWKEPAKYQLTAAAKGKMGGVSIGDGIKVTSDGTISLSGGTGISISNDTISNTGVISVTRGTDQNQISVKKGNNTTEIITINNVDVALRARKADIIAIDIESNDNDALVVGRYIPGANLGPGAGTTPPEFKATGAISSTKSGDSTIYNMNVSLAVDALSADKVGLPLIIKPLNDNGELDKNVDGKNWIEYDGSVEGEGLDAITWGDIDKLFNATPTV